MNYLRYFCLISFAAILLHTPVSGETIHDLQKKIVPNSSSLPSGDLNKHSSTSHSQPDVASSSPVQLVHGKSSHILPENDLSPTVTPTNTDTIQSLPTIDKSNMDSEIPIRAKTRNELLLDVKNSWNVKRSEIQRKNITPEEVNRPRNISNDSGLYQNSLISKVSNIIIPEIRFVNTPLSVVIESLSTLSEKNDTTEGSKGINFVIFGLVLKNHTDEPIINLNLKNISLFKLIEFIAKSSEFQFDITPDAVIFYKPDLTNEIIETQFFPIPRATLVKLTGNKTVSNPSIKNDNNKSNSIISDEQEIKDFFERAGINFKGVAGSNLAFDGSQIIVTTSSRNLKKISNILQKYSEVKQVEIETKFLEVQQGALDELGFRWQFGNRSNSKSFFRTGTDKTGQQLDNLRTLSEAFSSKNFSRGDGKIIINNSNSQSSDISTVVPNQPPGIPGQLNLGTSSIPLSNFTGVLNSLQCDVMIRALEQHSGSDLMSAPKLTVLSGKTAEIIIAMELRYPLNYGDIHSEVGSGSSALGISNSAGVTITAGTPRDFTMRNVGVEMRVTPIVEEDGSISLQLDPKVTEFEGFVEYGGMSIAVSSGSTVSIPSGFYQPIFSTREIHTEVNIVDGATVIMGGLTREEVKEVNDKVPILGDIPLLGKLFRSKSETTQKRNLLIFVTAHTVSSFGQKNVETPGAESLDHW